MSEPVHIVTVLTGTKYPEAYLQRLYNMTARNMERPFRFTVYTDLKRNLVGDIEQVDCSSWGLRGTFHKLRLFDPEILDHPFLFMDVTLIVKSSLEPLLRNVEHLGKSVSSRKDFSYDVINSCVMGVGPDAITSGIWNSYKQGDHPSEETPGDQTYTYFTLKRKGQLDHLGILDPGLIVSYRQLRKRWMKQPEEAMKELNQACILKFHGSPKIEETLDPRTAWKLALPKAPLHSLKFSRFLREEIRAWWQ